MKCGAPGRYGNAWTARRIRRLDWASVLTPEAEALKEAQAESAVILIGDADFAYDQIAGRTQQVMTQTVFVPSNGNLNFIQSSVEQLAGDSDLIGIRSRSSGNRPFVVVAKMEAAAQQKNVALSATNGRLMTYLTEWREK